MLDYIITSINLYVMHVCALIPLIFGISIYNDGLPKYKKMAEMFKTVIVLAAILGIFSSHSHHYYQSLWGAK